MTRSLQETLPEISHEEVARLLEQTSSSQINLCGQCLRGIELMNVHLRGARISEADVSAANLCGVSLSQADLHGSTFEGTALSWADLRGANLADVDLREADLSFADLSFANLRGSRLSQARLCGANLRAADLRGATLSDADVRGADLSGALLADPGEQVEICNVLKARGAQVQEPLSIQVVDPASDEIGDALHGYTLGFVVMLVLGFLIGMFSKRSHLMHRRARK